jgi:hypothetical protein
VWKKYYEIEGFGCINNVNLKTKSRPCSAGWLPASQQCFSLTPVQHQPPATSQPAVFFSHNKSASATSHPPAERGPSFSPFFLLDGVACFGQIKKNPYYISLKDGRIWVK